MTSIIAGPAAPPIIIRAPQCVARGVLVSVLAVVWEWLLTDVTRSRNTGRPVSQLFRLYGRIRFAMTFSAQRDEVAQMVRTSQPEWDLVMHVQSALSTLWTKAPLKLYSAVLALITIASTSARCLTLPIASRIRARLLIVMESDSNGLADRQSVCPTRIGAIAHRQNLRWPPIECFQAVRAHQSDSRNNTGLALTFIRAITRRSTAMIGVVSRPAMETLLRWVFTLRTRLHAGPFYPILSEVHI
jgi:hypothetical protein